MLKAFNMLIGSRPDAIHITSVELTFDIIRSSAKNNSSPHQHHQHYHHTTATNPESSKGLRKEWSPGYQHTPHLQTTGKRQTVKTIHPPTDYFLPPLFSCRAFSQGQGVGCRKMNCPGIISQLLATLFPEGSAASPCHVAWCTSITWTRRKLALWNHGCNLQADLGMETCSVMWGETLQQATGTFKKEWASLLSRHQQGMIQLLDTGFCLLGMLLSALRLSHAGTSKRNKQISLQVNRLQLIFLIHL